MKDILLKEALQRIDEQDFKKYYAAHTRAEVEKHFNISGYGFCALKKAYGVKKVRGIQERVESGDLDIANLNLFLQSNTIKDATRVFRVSRSSILQLVAQGSLHLPEKPSFLSYEEVRTQLDADTLKNLRSSHTLSEIASMYETSQFMVERLVRDYELRVRESVEEACSRINPVELQLYYQDHNHEDTAAHFSLSSWMLDYIIKRYDLRKDIETAVFQIKKTKLDRYGDENYTNPEKGKQTKLLRYGDKNYSNPEKRKQTRILHCGSLENSYRIARAKQQETMHKKYGDRYTEKSSGYCGRSSKPNLRFARLLEEKGLEFVQEFSLEGFSYDFKVGNNLIEINPTVTHNMDWSPFGNRPGVPFDYHLKKTKVAEAAGYRCIHVWDWDDINKIAQLVLPRQILYARKCEVRDQVSKDDCRDFLNNCHTQGSCRGQSVRLGLYYNNELVQIMTFGAPRYNKKYNWELLRLCTLPNYCIVGGAEKLFRYFLDHYHPSSIVGYCDRSKFRGDVYPRLGFQLVRERKPDIYWINLKTGERITDKLLERRGFDQLLGERYEGYGKETSNEALMREHWFVRLSDCGQATYTWKNAG